MDSEVPSNLFGIIKFVILRGLTCLLRALYPMPLTFCDFFVLHHACPPPRWLMVDWLIGHFGWSLRVLRTLGAVLINWRRAPLDIVHVLANILWHARLTVLIKSGSNVRFIFIFAARSPGWVCYCRLYTMARVHGVSPRFDHDFMEFTIWLV